MRRDDLFAPDPQDAAAGEGDRLGRTDAVNHPFVKPTRQTRSDRGSAHVAEGDRLGRTNAVNHPVVNEMQQADSGQTGAGVSPGERVGREEGGAPSVKALALEVHPAGSRATNEDEEAKQKLVSISTRIPRDVRDGIRMARAYRGITAQQVIREALSAWLEINAVEMPVRGSK